MAVLLLYNLYYTYTYDLYILGIFLWFYVILLFAVVCALLFWLLAFISLTKLIG